jgi:outer membrane receptor protein involved in Fe transport
MPNRTLGTAVSCGLLASLLVASRASAQAPLTTSLPPITVTAQKEPQDPGTLPVSVTAVSSDTILSDALTSVSQAGWFSPNTFFNEFTARKLSNPRFRGVGSSPANPGVTSYIDGNTAQRELLEHRVPGRRAGGVRPRPQSAPFWP